MLGALAVYSTHTDSVLQEGTETALSAFSVVGWVSGQAGRTVFEAGPVVDRVGRLAQETLLSRTVEGAPSHSRGVEALASHAEFEAFLAGEADVAGGVAVVAVGGTGCCEGEEGCEEEREGQGWSPVHEVFFLTNIMTPTIRIALI